MTCFIAGLLLGGTVGFFTAALMQAAHDEDMLMLMDELNMFDDEEIHENCTVQIWKNKTTGETSIGWWKEGDDDG